MNWNSTEFVWLDWAVLAIGVIGVIWAGEFSFVNGIYITCYRKATKWILKWPLILGWMGMYAVLIGYLLVAFFFPVYMGWIGFFFLAGAVFTGLTAYLYHEKIYNEQKQKVSRMTEIGRASCRERV